RRVCCRECFARKSVGDAVRVQSACGLPFLCASRDWLSPFAVLAAGPFALDVLPQPAAPLSGTPLPTLLPEPRIAARPENPVAGATGSASSSREYRYPPHDGHYARSRLPGSLVRRRKS